MLSLTYIRNALKVEQDRVQSCLHSFQQTIRETACDSSLHDRLVLEQLLQQIKRVHLNCRWRRLEVHILPEVKGTDEATDLLLSELESLRLLGLDLYRTSRDQLREAIEGNNKVDFHELRQTMKMYCRTLHELLSKEDQELFSMALGSMPEQTWFSIAQRFIQIDKEMLEYEEMGEVANRHLAEPSHTSSKLSIPGVESPPSSKAQNEPRAALSQERQREHSFPRPTTA